MCLFEFLENHIISLDINKISSNRKEVLKPLCNYIQTKIRYDERINLHFICTHNSRRIHLAQIWAQTISDFYDDNIIIHCYSGGTEIKAVYSTIINTLKKRGFQIPHLASSNNALYSINFANNTLLLFHFLKLGMIISILISAL